MNLDGQGDEVRSVPPGTFSWKGVAELIGLTVLTVSVVVLIYEVRANTAAIAYQAKMDAFRAVADPFFESDALSQVLAKIKTVDGFPPPIPAYRERYGLTAEEAILWTRHMIVLWGGIESTYLAYGPSPTLAQNISILLTNPDNQIYVGQRAALTASEEFLDYIRDVQAQAGAPDPFADAP